MILFFSYYFFVGAKGSLSTVWMELVDESVLHTMLYHGGRYFCNKKYIIIILYCTDIFPVYGRLFIDMKVNDWIYKRHCPGGWIQSYVWCTGSAFAPLSRCIKPDKYLLQRSNDPNDVYQIVWN